MDEEEKASLAFGWTMPSPFPAPAPPRLSPWRAHASPRRRLSLRPFPSSPRLPSSVVRCDLRRHRQHHVRLGALAPDPRRCVRRSDSRPLARAGGHSHWQGRRVRGRERSRSTAGLPTGTGHETAAGRCGWLRCASLSLSASSFTLSPTLHTKTLHCTLCLALHSSRVRLALVDGRTSTHGTGTHPSNVAEQPARSRSVRLAPGRTLAAASRQSSLLSLSLSLSSGPTARHQPVRPAQAAPTDDARLLLCPASRLCPPAPRAPTVCWGWDGPTSPM